MPLSASDLATKIQSGIEASAGGAPSSSAELQAYCMALATAIVTEITSSAVVNVTGVQSGSGTAEGQVT